MISMGRRICVLILLSLIAASWTKRDAAFAQAAQPITVQSANIDRNDVLILVRTVLLALDDADKTGNYTVLRDLGAPGFQVNNTAAQLGDIFVKERRDKIDLSGVAVLDPQLTLLPRLENGYLHMAGFFPSVPMQLNFNLWFAPVNGAWRLFGLAVNFGSSEPVAPAMQAPPAQAQNNSARPHQTRVHYPYAHRFAHGAPKNPSTF